MKKGVEVITDLETARVLVDPMRREVVRLLADRPMTENELAEALGLSDPSVGHHLKILKQSELIRIVRKQAEEHGIVQKFYETNAMAYFIDDRGMPLEIERYFMPVNLERGRGIVAVLNAITGGSIRVRTKELEEFAKVLASAIVHVAPKYSKRASQDREEVISAIYRDALNYLVENPDLLPQNVQSVLLNALRPRQFKSS